mgnify:CR=1 FL=1
MKKICLITFHSAHNYGAMLQSYALQKILKKKYDIKIINYRNYTIDKNYKLFVLNKKNYFLLFISYFANEFKVAYLFLFFKAFINSLGLERRACKSSE